MRGLTLHLVLCAAAALAPLARPVRPERAAPADLASFPGWPEAFEGRPLRALAPTDLDRRFADGFVGRVARFTDGTREIVFRWAPRAHRDVHPSEVCFRAAGWDVVPLPLAVGADGALAGGFRATRDDETLVVREQVRDAAGRTWGDVTAWYWASLLGSTDGPAWVVTVAERD